MKSEKPDDGLGSIPKDVQVQTISAEVPSAPVEKGNRRQLSVIRQQIGEHNDPDNSNETGREMVEIFTKLNDLVRNKTVVDSELGIAISTDLTESEEKGKVYSIDGNTVIEKQSADYFLVEKKTKENIEITNRILGVIRQEHGKEKIRAMVDEDIVERLSIPATRNGANKEFALKKLFRIEDTRQRAYQEDIIKRPNYAKTDFAFSEKIKSFSEAAENSYVILTSVGEKFWGGSLGFRKASEAMDMAGTDLVGGIGSDESGKIIFSVDVTTASKDDKLEDKVKNCLRGLLGGKVIRDLPDIIRENRMSYMNDVSEGGTARETIPFVIGFNDDKSADMIRLANLALRPNLSNKQMDAIKTDPLRYHLVSQIELQASNYLGILEAVKSMVDDGSYLDNDYLMTETSSGGIGLGNVAPGQIIKNIDERMAILTELSKFAMSERERAQEEGSEWNSDYDEDNFSQMLMDLPGKIAGEQGINID